MNILKHLVGSIIIIDRHVQLYGFTLRSSTEINETIFRRVLLMDCIYVLHCKASERTRALQTCK